MGGSLRIARFAGIGVYVHWTFGILLAWIVYQQARQGMSPLAMAGSVGFILALFGCVVLHEFGHALTARRYGVKTRDITLLPIGGVARLERMPEQPMQEFWVAVAGPAVNVVIAAILFGVIYGVGRVEMRYDIDIVRGDFLFNLMAVNIALVLFNMLPAFPMDGGRVLRSLLALKLPRVRATRIAARVGQVMALLLALWGLQIGNYLLLFIAVFVVLGAQAEVQAAELREVFRGATVGDAMIRQFQVLSGEEPLSTAADIAAGGLQQDFPVSDKGEIVGLLLERDIARALQSKNPRTPIASVIRTDCPAVSKDESLERVMGHMQATRCPAMLVTENDGEVVGLLTRSHIARWIKLRAAHDPRTTPEVIEADRSASRTPAEDGEPFV